VAALAYKNQSHRLPWLLLAGVLLLMFIIIGLTTVRRVQRGQEFMERALTAQAELVVTSLEGATRAGMRNRRRGILRMQSLVEEMLQQPNLRSLAVIGPKGELLAAGVAKANVDKVERVALGGLPLGIEHQIQERLPVTKFLKHELVVGRPFEPLAPFRRGGRPLPPWARPSGPREPRPEMGMGRPGGRPGRERGRMRGGRMEDPDMARHHMEMMGWLDKDAPPGYVLVRMSTKSFFKAHKRAIFGSLLLAAMLFAAAALVAWGMFAYARRRQGEMERLREEVEQSRHLAAIGRLAGSVAHEVRNPLSALRGLVQYLGKDAESGSRQMECAETAISEVDRLERVVSDLLDYTRDRRPRLAPLDLAESVKATRALLADDAQNQGVQITTELAKDLPLVLADPDHVRQIVVNLLLNALEANDGRGDIKLRASGQDGQVLLEVIDQGPGLPPGDPEQLFDPFFSTKARGTGLGLAIARRLAQVMGGGLSAANGHQGGAVFTLNLPGNEA
jgi:two-component system, NtrC family, sensor histidine kinase HydH